MNRKDRRAAKSSGAAIHGSPQIEALYNQAIAHHRSGQLNEAHQLYKKILEAEPGHADSLHKIGIIAAQVGQPASAVELFNHALRLRDDMPYCHNDLGDVLLSLGRLAEAEKSYNKAIRLKKDYYEAHNNLGNVLSRTGESAKAAAQYEKAIALRPDIDAAYNNLGALLRDQGKLAEAAAQLETAIALAPNSMHARNNLGLVLRDQGRPAEAAAQFEKAIALHPDFAEAYNNLGLALVDQGKLAEAAEQYRHALRIAPHAVVYGNLGNVLQDLGDSDGALAAHQKALELDPQNVAACVNMGNIFVSGDRPAEALLWYGKAIGMDPRNIVALKNRAAVLKDLGRIDEALASYDLAYRIAPDYEELAGLRAHFKMSVCDWSEYAAAEKIAAGIRGGKLVSPPFALVGLPATAADQLACAKLFVARKCPPAPVPLYAEPRTAHDKIRLAYLSADLRDHALAYLAAGLFEAHDRSKFETTAVSFGADDKSPMRARIAAAFDHFVDARLMGNDQVAQTLLERKIDIAVDLTGFTQNNRAGIFAKRVAPLQVGYLGFPGTMGAPYMDYIIADETVIPEDLQACFSEKIVYMPDTYQVNDRKRAASPQTPSRAELGLPEKAFVFCAFNAHYKITPEVFDVWMRLLKTVDGSVLWLLEGNETALTNLSRETQQRGVDPQRLVFAPRMKNAAHIARHRQADLFLDNLPCNAHTTASDALYAGLPVLTCLGQTFAGRVAASLLRAAGLPELVTSSLKEYEALAAQLAQEPQKLDAFKARLSQNRDTCPLFDTEKFTRHLEAAYRTMWQRHLEGKAPETFRASEKE